MTYWDKCIFGDGMDTPPWETKEIPGQGLCAFALKRFNIGDLILKEKPTVICSGHHPFTDLQLSEIQRNIEVLSTQDREAFYSMANSIPQRKQHDDDNENNLLTQLQDLSLGSSANKNQSFHDDVYEAAGIFITNSFDMTDNPSGEACAMYCAIGRLNHSCYPNTQQTHLSETGEEVLYACRTIEVGDEINDCYIDLRMSRLERNAYLKQHYFFECTCPACSFHPCTANSNHHNTINNNNNRNLHLDSDSTLMTVAIETSSTVVLQQDQQQQWEIQMQTEDKQRVKAAQLDSIVLEIVQDGDAECALNIALDLIQLLLKPNNQLWSTRYIADAYLYVYHIALSLDRKQQAINALKDAHRWNILLQGEYTPDSKRTSSLLLQHQR